MAAIATGAAVHEAFDTGLTQAANNGGNGPLVVFIEAYSSLADTDIAVTWNGVAMAASFDGDDADRVNVFTLDSPATGAHDLVISGFAAARRFRVWFVPTDDAAFVAAGLGANTGAQGSNSTGAITTAPGDLILYACNIRTGSDPTVVASGDANQVQEGVLPSSAVAWGWEAQATADDASTTMGCTWTGSFNSYSAYARLSHVASTVGPAVDPDPLPATVNGEATGTLTSDEELDGLEGVFLKHVMTVGSDRILGSSLPSAP